MNNLEKTNLTSQSSLFTKIETLDNIYDNEKNKRMSIKSDVKSLINNINIDINTDQNILDNNIRLAKIVNQRLNSKQENIHNIKQSHFNFPNTNEDKEDININEDNININTNINKEDNNNINTNEDNNNENTNEDNNNENINKEDINENIKNEQEHKNRLYLRISSILSQKQDNERLIKTAYFNKIQEERQKKEIKEHLDTILINVINKISDKFEKEKQNEIQNKLNMDNKIRLQTIINNRILLEQSILDANYKRDKQIQEQNELEQKEKNILEENNKKEIYEHLLNQIKYRKKLEEQSTLNITSKIKLLNQIDNLNIKKDSLNFIINDEQSTKIQNQISKIYNQNVLKKKYLLKYK